MFPLYAMHHAASSSALGQPILGMGLLVGIPGIQGREGDLALGHGGLARRIHDDFHIEFEQTVRLFLDGHLDRAVLQLFNAVIQGRVFQGATRHILVEEFGIAQGHLHGLCGTLAHGGQLGIVLTQWPHRVHEVLHIGIFQIVPVLKSLFPCADFKIIVRLLGENLFLAIVDDRDLAAFIEVLRVVFGPRGQAGAAKVSAKAIGTRAVFELHATLYGEESLAQLLILHAEGHLFMGGMTELVHERVRRDAEAQVGSCQKITQRYGCVAQHFLVGVHFFAQTIHEFFRKIVHAEVLGRLAAVDSLPELGWLRLAMCLLQELRKRRGVEGKDNGQMLHFPGLAFLIGIIEREVAVLHTAVLGHARAVRQLERGEEGLDLIVLRLAQVVLDVEHLDVQLIEVGAEHGGQDIISVLNELQARITTAQELVTPQRLTAIMQELLQSVAVRNVIADVVDAQAAQHHMALTPASRQHAVEVVLARNPALGQTSTAAMATQALTTMGDDIATISYAMTVLPGVWEKQLEQAAEDIAKATGLPKTGVLRSFMQSSIGEEALFKAYLADTRTEGPLPPQPDDDEAAQWRKRHLSAFVGSLQNALKRINEADMPGSGKSLLRTRLLEGKVAPAQVVACLAFANDVAANVSTEPLRNVARGFQNGQQDAAALLNALADMHAQMEQRLPANLGGATLNDGDKALLRHMGRQALIVSLVRKGGFNSLATLSAEQRTALKEASYNLPMPRMAAANEGLALIRACRSQLARRVLPYSVASAILEGTASPEEEARLDQFLTYGMPLLRKYAPGLPPEARPLLWRMVGHFDFREEHHAAIALLVPQLAQTLSRWNGYRAAVQQAFQNVREMVPQFQAQSLRDLDVPILSRFTRRLLQSKGGLTPESFGALLHDVLINAHVPAVSTSLANTLTVGSLNTVAQPFHEAAAATLRDLSKDFPEQLGQAASLDNVSDAIRRHLADSLRSRGGVATPRLFSDMLRHAFLAVQRQAALVKALKAQWQPPTEVDRKPDSFWTNMAQGIEQRLAVGDEQAQTLARALEQATTPQAIQAVVAKLGFQVYSAITLARETENYMRDAQTHLYSRLQATTGLSIEALSSPRYPKLDLRESFYSLQSDILAGQRPPEDAATVFQEKADSVAQERLAAWNEVNGLNLPAAVATAWKEYILTEGVLSVGHTPLLQAAQGLDITALMQAAQTGKAQDVYTALNDIGDTLKRKLESQGLWKAGWGGDDIVPLCQHALSYLIGANPQLRTALTPELVDGVANEAYTHFEVIPGESQEQTESRNMGLNMAQALNISSSELREPAGG